MTPLLTKVPSPLRQLFWSVYGRSVWDASFDVVLLVSVLQAVGHPDRALRESHRVLSPDGVLCVVYFPPHPNKALPLRAELKVRAETLRPAGRVTRLWQLALMAIKSSAERQRLTHQWTPNGLLALLGDAGYAARIEQTQPWIIATGRRGAEHRLPCAERAETSLRRHDT